MSNFNFNTVTLAGHITQPPELKTTQSGISVCSFTIAVNRRKTSEQVEQKADFFNCVAWRNQAELISKYFSKGSAICVIGTLQNRGWTDKESKSHIVTEVIVSEVYFIDSRSDAAPSAPEPAKQQQPYVPDAYKTAQATAPKPTAPPQYEEVTGDDNLPF